MFRRQLISVTAVGALAQAAAFAKVWLIARYFGVGVDLDAYYLAFVVPTLVSNVVGGAIQTGLFPIHARVSVERGEHALQNLERSLFWFVVLVGITLTCVVFVFSTEIARAIAAQGGPILISQTEYVLKVAAFAIALNLAGDYLSGLLALRGNFVIAAAAPIANAAIGAFVLVTWTEDRLAALTWGTLLGIVVQIAIVFAGGLRAKVRLLGPLDAQAELRAEASDFLRLGAWTLPGTLSSNLSLSIPPLLLVTYGVGAVSAFGYAFRIHQSAVQLLIMTASPVLLARFAELIARRNFDSLELLQHKARWASAAIGLAGFGGVALFGEKFLIWVFGYGEFDANAAERVAQHWLWLAPGLGFATYGIVLSKRLQADRQPIVLSGAALAGLIALLLAAWSLRPIMDEWAVPAAFVFAVLVSTLLMEGSVLLRRGRRPAGG